ncbi:DnaD domain protein [Isachenkonia alkalipeptolytica]|nr:DnaD domain protein [Isachenkonia alkalipeptolytica]
MFYKKSRSIEELESVSIDNIFLNKFLPKANGTYVKVYLLGYQKALQTVESFGEAPVTSHQSLGELLGIPLSDVLDAWKYWEAQGVIKTHPLGPSSHYEERENFSVEFLDLKEKFLLEHHYRKTISHNKETPREKTPVEKTAEDSPSQESPPVGSGEHYKNPYNCTPEDLIEANKVPQIRTMFGEINKIIHRSLYPNEKIEILEWFFNFNIEPPLIVKAYSFAKHKKNISTVQYVGGVVRNWYDQGITSVEQLQAHLESTKDRFSLYNRIFRALGFSNREPSEKEREFMDLWFDDFGFSLEIILRACEESVKIANPNISYIHGVLKNWHKNKVGSLEDVEELRQASKQKKNAKPSLQKPSRDQFKTKFHLSDSRTSKYNAEELEALIMKRQNKE